MQLQESLLVAEVNKLRRARINQLKQQQYQQETRQARGYTDESRPGQTTAPDPSQENPDFGVPGAQHESDNNQHKVFQQKELPDSNNYQEKEIIRLLLHYAEKELIFSITQPGKQKEEITVRVVDFIVQDILDDELQFENPACAFIFAQFVDERNRQKIPDIRQFFNHPDEAIKNMVVDLLSTPYSLSKNWEDRHGIFVSNEEDLLKDLVLQAVYSFKLRKLEKMIDANQKKIKEVSEQKPEAFEVLTTLLEEHLRLKNVRSSFAKELNRIVTK